MRAIESAWTGVMLRSEMLSCDVGEAVVRELDLADRADLVTGDGDEIAADELAGVGELRRGARRSSRR